MSKWLIQIVNVGRNKVSRSYTVTYDTLPEVEKRAHEECRKFIVSKSTTLLSFEDLTYSLTAGGPTVGRIRIQSL